MSTAYSPKIVTDGLVFYYDKANVQKSWKGEPTTNILTNVADMSAGWTLSGTTMTSTDIFAETAVTSAHFILQDQSVTAALDYTLSFLAKAGGASIVQMAPSTGFSSANYVTFDLSAGTKTQVGSGTSVMTDKGDGWYLCAFTVPATSTTAGGRFAIGLVPLESSSRLFSYLGATINTILLKDPQFEQKSSHTRFVDGTRSTTQAIVDLTGNSTITPTSLAYTQDDFNFDGTSYLTPALSRPSPVVESTTYELIFRYNDTAGFRGLTGASTYQSAGFGVGFGSATTMRMLASAASISTEPTFSYISSEISHGVFVFNGRQLKAYRNGELVYSNADIGFDIVEDTRNIRIGNVGQGGWGSANSDIYSAKVYNKELTAAEIEQNFQAQRGRYGI
jgi:hypothetical protein